MVGSERKRAHLGQNYTNVEHTAYILYILQKQKAEPLELYCRSNVTVGGRHMLEQEAGMILEQKADMILE